MILNVILYPFRVVLIQASGPDRCRSCFFFLRQFAVCSGVAIMFNDITAMEELDKIHSRDDIFAIWVKVFNSGKWIISADAY